MTNEEFLIGVMLFGLVCGVVSQLARLRAERQRRAATIQEQIERTARLTARLTDRLEEATFNRDWYGTPETRRKAKREKPDDTSHGVASYYLRPRINSMAEWSSWYQGQPSPPRDTPTDEEVQEIRRKPPERPIFNNARPDTTGLDDWENGH